MKDELHGDWKRVVAFHGHACPGLAIGYRVTIIAMEALKAIRAEDEEVIAILEHDACGVDAVQAVIGCTAGKGNLILRDYGKQVYSFICRNSGRAVRISVNPAMMKDVTRHQFLRNKISTGEATKIEKDLFVKNRQKAINRLLTCPPSSFCTIRLFDADIPGEARFYRSLVCSDCGELVMEPRARIKNGKKVCIPCAGSGLT